MKSFRLKGFISILLCLVMVIGLSGSVMVKAEEDKKIDSQDILGYFLFNE